MAVTTDIDIDFADRTKALKGLWYVPAAMISRGERQQHNSGVYFQDIPIDPFDHLAVYEYHDAAERGFFKLDFLPNYLYEGIRDEAHLLALHQREPIWELLEDREFVGMLAHISEHFDTVQTIKPKSVIDLAVCLAILRPGKKHLLNSDRALIDAEIWKPTTDYHFKKSHAVAYACSLVVQINLIVEQAYS